MTAVKLTGDLSAGMQVREIGHTNPGSRILTSFAAMGYGPSTSKSGSASSSLMTHRRACPGSFPAPGTKPVTVR
jgi:hypothetical protein